jgi:hypothetical protein
MSLNKLTTSTDYLTKQYLNVGCNDIKCTSLAVAGNTVTPIQNGSYTPAMTSTVGVFNNILAYYSVDGSYISVWFEGNLNIVNTAATVNVVLPLPIGFLNSPAGTRPLGVITAIEAGGPIGAMVSNSMDITGDSILFSFRYNGTTPLDTANLFVNGHFRVFGNPVV